jgi:thiamine pyrophosphokinase
MAQVAGLEWEGLRWPLRGGFRPDGRIGTSNIALGGRVRMAFDAPRMLLILPAALLGPVAERLRGAADLSSVSPR